MGADVNGEARRLRYGRIGHLGEGGGTRRQGTPPWAVQGQEDPRRHHGGVGGLDAGGRRRAAAFQGPGLGDAKEIDEAEQDEGNGGKVGGNRQGVRGVQPLQEEPLTGRRSGAALEGGDTAPMD